MNREFKLRYDQMREGDPSKTEETLPTDTGNGLSHAPGHGRNLCFVWPDGKRIFLNYAYLLAGEFDVGNERNEIKLSFSSHTAILRGYGLESLFMALLDHLPRIIIAIDERYVSQDDTSDSQPTIVLEILVEKDTP